MIQATVDQKEMVKVLAASLGATDRRGTMPVLANVLIENNGSGLFLSTTDLETSFRGHCAGKAKSHGAVSVPAHALYTVLKAMKSGPVKLESGENKSLIVSQDKTNTRINGLPVDQVPPISPFIDRAAAVEVDAKQLRDMIGQVIPGMSTDDLRYHLTAVKWKILPADDDQMSELRLVSTDGHRLMLAQQVIPEIVYLDLGPECLIPAHGMRELFKFLEKEKSVFLCCQKPFLTAQTDDKQLQIRLVPDKKFPDYRQIIPAAFAFEVVADRKALLETIKRVSLVSTERFKGIVFKINGKKQEMTVTFDNPEIGQTWETLPVEIQGKGFPKGKIFEFGFNARFFIEPLNLIGSEKVVMSVIDGDRPVKLSGQGEAGYFNVIMPMSL